MSTLCKKETGERDGGKGKRGKEEEVMQREKRGELAKRGREKMERWRGEKVSQLNSHRAMYKERRGGKKKAKGSLLAKGTHFSLIVLRFHGLYYFCLFFLQTFPRRVRRSRVPGSSTRYGQ